MKNALLACMVMALTLSGCVRSDDKDGQGGGAQSGAPQSDLERAAIEAGVIPDISKVSLAGAFERQSDLGVDRFCAVGNDDRGYQIGILAVFGPQSKCEAIGSAQRNGEAITISLKGKKECQFVARFDGVELQIPGKIPDGCSSYCSPRAGFDGVSLFLTGEGNAVARSIRGRDIENLCPGG